MSVTASLSTVHSKYSLTPFTFSSVLGGKTKLSYTSRYKPVVLSMAPPINTMIGELRIGAFDDPRSGLALTAMPIGPGAGEAARTNVPSVIVGGSHRITTLPSGPG